MIGRNIGFTRWYDRLPSLSQAVRMMEQIQPYQQQMIASIIVGSMQMHQVSQRNEHGVKKLGTEKVIGLMKSKVKRRWYDRDPMVHQAFNHLYLMPDPMRHETAIKIMVCIKAMEAYQERKGRPLPQESSLVKSIFEKQLQYLMEKTEFIVNSEVDKTDLPNTDVIAIETKMLQSEHPAAQVASSPESEQTAEQGLEQGMIKGAMGNSKDGMRLIRIKIV